MGKAGPSQLVMGILAAGIGELPKTAGIDALLSLPLITVYLLYALGLVVIYRASRVLNLAHGAMATAPAYLFYTLAGGELAKGPLPAPVAAVVAVAAGAGFGLVVERFVVRRLRRAGPTAQTVGTVAVFSLTVALLGKVYGTGSLRPPRLFPSGAVIVGVNGIRYGQIITFIIGVAITAGLFALFRFTSIGLAMRASADHRRGAMLMGMNVERTTAIAWAIGGGLAALAGVLVSSLTNLHPYTLSLQVLPAFVAVLIGGLESLGGAILGAVVVGLVQGEVPAMSLIPGLRGLTTAVGFPQLVLLIVAFVVMAVRGNRFVGSRVRDEIVTETAPVSRSGTGRRPPWFGAAAIAVGVGVAVFPFLPVPFSVLGDATLAGFYLVVALSLVVLTGWVGQISLAQAEFVGVGAFVTALLANKAHIPFPVNLPLAAAAGGIVAAALGVVALRVRGLYLAVATLVFAWAADTFLFHQSWFGLVGGAASVHPRPLGKPGTYPYLDFNNVRLIYLLFAALAAAVIYALANMRESKTGRAMFALRGSEVAAASLGINVTRYKLLAFAVSGVIAGAAGNLYMMYLRSVTPETVNFTAALFFLAIAVVGGLSSLGGAIGAALVFAALQEVFFRVHALSGFLDVTAAGLLLVVLLGYPGGFAALPADLAARWRARAARQGATRTAAREAAAAASERRRTSRRRPVRRIGASLARTAARLPAPPARLRRALVAVGRMRPRPRRPVAGEDALSRLARPNRTSEEQQLIMARVVPEATSPDVDTPSDVDEQRPPWEGYRPERRPVDDPTRAGEPVLTATGVSVRFGGLTAVDDVSLSVNAGEIVGLIGANGAGKTTLFNVISGLQPPVAGRIELFGADVTGLDVHQRAVLGMARTFQDIQLFPQLDVFDNLLVATHNRNHSTLLGHLVVGTAAVGAERTSRQRVVDVLEFLGLSHLAHRHISDLSFGLLRLVEVARALVTGSRLILLDEPASGLDNAETDRLAELLLYVRAELEISLLVVEHDVRAVVGMSDYMYVLDRGVLIGEGRPAAVQSSPAVIDAYLGQAAPAGAFA